MPRAVPVLVLLALGLGPAAAQSTAPQSGTLAAPLNEQVIVTAPRLLETPDAVAHDMVRSIAAPSTLLGQIARFRKGICARTDGMSSRTLNAYVTQRILDVAARAGAPIAPQPCVPNVMVRFTDQPQELLDDIHNKASIMLGYHGAAKVSYPIQAWYMTGTTDLRGNTVIDQETFSTLDVDLQPGMDGGPPTVARTHMDNTPFSAIGGWRGHPDLTSDIVGVYIIADRGKTGDFKLGPVADYIAMLSLSQTRSFDGCQAVASISNLMAPGCSPSLKPDAITPSDIAYLHGVYTMDPGASLQVQQNDIAGVLATALPPGAGQSGKPQK